MNQSPAMFIIDGVHYAFIDVFYIYIHIHLFIQYILKMLVVSGCFNGMLTNIAVLKAKAIHDERTVALHIFKRTVICNCYDMKYTGTVQIQTS